LALVLLGVTLLTFSLQSLSPVDPAEAHLRRLIINPTQEQIDDARREMGTDQPLHVQYLRWVSGVLRGDLGKSIMTQNAVATDIAKRLPVTFTLVGLSLLWILLLCIPLSVLSAARSNRPADHIVRGFTIFGVSIPNFWLGFLLLLLFSVKFGVVKVVGGGNGIMNYILPSVALGLPIACSSIRIFRAALLSCMSKEYVIYAKARGFSDMRILWLHVLKNALPTLVTLLCQNLGYMIAGSAVLESVFSLNGLGNHLVLSVLARDLPTINGCVLVIGVVFVLTGVAADLINARLQPKQNALEVAHG
jgi:ABC-type dipeptide/oligopeptide/nickel transport system permease component